MNALGISLLWSALQVSLFCLAGTLAYLAARRGNRARGAPLLCGVLITAAAMTAASFSPWPRWWTWSATRSGQSAPRVSKGSDKPPMDQPSSAALSSANDATEQRAFAQIELSVSGFLSALLGDVHDRLAGAPRGNANDGRWRWPAWLALAVFAGAAIGAARMLVGWLALGRLLRATRPVQDAALVALLSRLRGQLRCRREIELREMATPGCSPATVGWRRPVILLPADWRQWTNDTRLAILAHETAHVAQGDFATWLAVQFSVVVNFYNPLVHWLSSRLRLEQELAADARGAALAGGARRYAATLARLALAQDDSRPLWAGRPFFPTRGTLMRRIEMLHHQSTGEPRSPSKTWRVISLATLIAGGLAVSGIRGPARVARAEETTATNTAAVEKQTLDKNASSRFDRSYLPANAIAVISLKPLRVADSTTVLEPVLSTFPFAANVTVAFSTTGNGVDEVETIILATANKEGRPSASSDSTDPAVLQIIRMRKPHEAGKLREMVFGQAPDGVIESTCMGYPCFSARSDVSGHLVNYVLVDDRTLVVVRERDIPTVLAADAQSHPSWYDAWLKIADSPLALACVSPELAAMEGKPGETADAQDRIIRSILGETAFLFAHVQCASGELRISANARCVSPDQAIGVTKTLQSGVTLFTTALNSAPQIFERSAMPKEFQSIDVAGALLRTVSNLQLNRRESEVQAEIRFDAAFVTQIAEAVKALTARQSAELKVRDEQDQKAHAEKLGRLVKAFDAYRAEHGRYPAAAIVGPDGKTPHSWRVELLPYLDEKALFDEYKLNESWDSEHNKRLVKKIPGVYATSQWSEKGHADYFVVSGAGTLFDPTEANDRESADDPPGETILVLQSHQRVPWTKPLDIETTADHNPTHPFRFGKGFYAAFADGTVKFVSQETDAATIRALFTKAGGEELKLR